MATVRGKAEEIDLDMPSSPGAELLQRVPLFKTLGYQETLELAQITRLERREKGDILIAQDSLGQALYILKDGLVAVRRRDPVTGEYKELTKLQPGELFGEMSLIDDQLTTADVVAATDVQVLVLPRKDFEQLLANRDRLAAKIYKCFCRALTDKLRKANVKLADAQERLARTGA